MADPMTIDQMFQILLTTISDSNQELKNSILKLKIDLIADLIIDQDQVLINIVNML